MRLLDGEELIWEGHPSWRSTISFYVKWTLISLLPLLAILGANAAGARLPVWAGAALLVAGCALTVLAGWVRRYFTRYRITSRHLLIRTGILSRNESSASLDRVQNIRVLQSPLERLLRTGTVDFDTASGDAADAELRFAGIDRPRDLRDHILEAIRRSHDADRQGGLA
ncbi:MAG TPA: PH domain-containing protein [Gaiellaceae bacterium]|nr:PH domain-containing protein [Gaiellaceae bacterium]